MMTALRHLWCELAALTVGSIAICVIANSECLITCMLDCSSAWQMVAYSLEGLVHGHYRKTVFFALMRCAGCRPSEK